MVSSIQYRKLRAPRSHGDILVSPSVAQASIQLREIASAELTEIKFGKRPLADIRQVARRNLLTVASEYVKSYSTILPKTIEFDRPIVMAGHQPTLFHPGVWFKNFLLDRIAQQGTPAKYNAVNLVIDNDTLNDRSVRVPFFDGTYASLKHVPFDKQGASIPYEEYAGWDDTVFQSFPGRLKDRLAESQLAAGWEPLVEQYWNEVNDVAEAMGGRNLAYAFAAARHRLELSTGLRNLEVPLSQVVDTKEFTAFLYQIVEQAEAFGAIYNRSIQDYRDVHKIRGRLQPVPDLNQRDGWQEVPFWIWHRDDPVRKPLFFRRAGAQFGLTDFASLRFELNSESFADQISELRIQGIKIRPRALMTTLYARLVLSDLFIHGIGGSKYDQVTDLIAERFFGCSLPGYLTATATLKLPFEGGLVSASNLNQIRQTIRDWKYHPEILLEANQEPTAGSARRKRDWIERVAGKKVTATQQRELEKINEAVQSMLPMTLDDLEKQARASEENQRVADVFGSREYSFCLFDESVMQQLKDLARAAI